VAAIGREFGNSGILPPEVREHLNILNWLDMLPKESDEVDAPAGECRLIPRLRFPPRGHDGLVSADVRQAAVRLSCPTLLPVRDDAAIRHRSH
jgi:hypothetical protein